MDAGGKTGKATFVTKYDSDGVQVLSSSVRLGVDNLQLRASCSDRTFVSSSNLSGLMVGLEKPGCFTLDYNVKEQVPKFGFTGSGRILGRDLKLAYFHTPLTKDAVVAECELLANAQNRIAGRVVFPSARGHLKLALVHPSGATLEPQVDLPSRSWNVAVSHRLADVHTVRASYDRAGHAVGLAWSKDAPEDGKGGQGAGACRMSATIPINEPRKMHVLLEKVWNFDF